VVIMIDVTGNVPVDVLNRLKILFGTPKGSVPLDRAFGLDHSFVDLPMNVARLKIIEAGVTAMRRYEPDYAIKDAQVLSRDAQQGEYDIKVVIGYAD